MVTICLFLLFISAADHDAIQTDLTFITDINPVYRIPEKQRETSEFSLRQTNEIKLAFTGMIRLYQIFVSPQSPPTCNFTVTCSQFLSYAVRKYGFAHGILMGADRLTRCTHGTRYLYEIDPVTGRAIDHSIEAYYLFSRSRVKRNITEKK
jgi:putative component of membrane protein insertase Oxa1/YidC/SpoIIIJ protein YidD